MKKLLILAVLGIVGWLAYTLGSGSPESKTCARLAELCGASDGEQDSCEEELREIRSMVGSKALDRVEDCVDESDACLEATACMGAGIMKEGADSFLEGLQRGLRN